MGARTGLLLAVALLALLPGSAQAAKLYSSMDGPVTAGFSGLQASGPVYRAQQFVATASGTARTITTRAQTNFGELNRGFGITILEVDPATGKPGSLVGAADLVATDDSAPNTLCAPSFRPFDLVAGRTYYAMVSMLDLGTVTWMYHRAEGATRTVVTQNRGADGWTDDVDAAGQNPPPVRPTVALRIDDSATCGPQPRTIPVAEGAVDDMYARVGGTHFQTITVHNDGTAPLAITGHTFSGPDAAAFTLRKGEPGGVMDLPYTTGTVAPNPEALEFLYVVCNGSGSEGPRSARLTLHTNGGDIGWPVSCIIDSTPPSAMEFTINPNGRSGWFVTNPATFGARASDPGSGDRVIAIACSSSVAGSDLLWNKGGPATFDLVKDGVHNLGCHATDVARNVNPPGTFTTTVKVDATEPNSAKTGGPAANTNQTSATFTWNATDATSGVQEIECRLDDAAQWTACASGQTVSGLSDGIHTFRTRARDVAGNLETTPETWTWRVDTIPPDTTLGAMPASPTTATGAAPAVNGTDPDGSGVIDLQCSLDGGAWGGCGPYSGLAEGSHTLRARAVDRAGNIDPTPAEHTWSIDRTAPRASFTQAPPAHTTATSATFAFTGVDAGPATTAGFECALDGAAFAACTSPATYEGLAIDAEHTLAVRAIDVLGNVQAAPTVHRWRISKPPVAVDDALKTVRDLAAEVDVLTNDVEPSGATIAVLDFAATSARGGAITATATGLRYTPPTGFTGTDTFTYRVRNGNGLDSAPATVTVTVLDPTTPEGQAVLQSAASRGPGAGSNGPPTADAAARPDRFPPILDVVHRRRGRLTFTSSEAGMARIVIRHLRWRGRGAAPSVTIELKIPAGSTSLRFRSKLKGLVKGPYRMTLTATDVAGNRSAPSRRAFLVPLTPRR